MIVRLTLRRSDEVVQCVPTRITVFRLNRHFLLAWLVVLGCSLAHGLSADTRKANAAENRLFIPRAEDREAAITWEAAGYEVQIVTPRLTLADAEVGLLGVLSTARSRPHVSAVWSTSCVQASLPQCSWER